MEAKHAIGWFLGVGLAGLAQQWIPSVGLEAVDLAVLMPWLIFLSGAVAIVTLAPAAFDAGRPWLARTAALIPGAVLGFVAEQLEEALVPGGAGAGLWNNVALSVFTVLATAWLAWRASGDQRRWIAYGLGAGTVLALASLGGFGLAMLTAQLLTLVVLVGLIAAWLRDGRKPRRAEGSDPEIA